MKQFFTFFALLLLFNQCLAQRKKTDKISNTPVVDSIAFHLYTDSLKKGVHNYINVDGRLPKGGWYPLTAEDILFDCEEGHFEGNNLVLPADFKKEKVIITATYKRNQQISRKITIYIKTLEDGPLKTKEEIMDELRGRPKKKRGR